MNYITKTALFDKGGNRLSDFFDEIDTETSELFAIVTNITDNEETFNFLKPDGKLLSPIWFKHVNYFKKGDIAVKVVLLNGSENLLHFSGKLLLKREDYKVKGNINDIYGVTVIKNKEDKVNYVNEDGKIICKRWCYMLNEYGYGIVRVTKNKENILKKDGSFVLKYSVDSIRMWQGKYYVATDLKHHKIHIIRMSDYEILFTSSVRSENGFALLPYGLRITNAEGKENVISSSTLKPVFEDWKLSINRIPYIDMLIIVREDIDSKNNLFIYDYNGRKLTEKGFSTMYSFTGNACTVEYYPENCEHEEPIISKFDFVTAKLKSTISELKEG